MGALRDDFLSSMKDEHIHRYQKQTYCEAKKRLMQKVSPIIREIHTSAVCMVVEPIINERWLNKLDLENINKNIVYRTDCETNKLSSAKPAHKWNYPDRYNINTMRKLLKSDPIISKCDNESLVSGYLRNNDNHIYIPSDIIIMTTLFCGVISSLLPYITRHKNKYFDIGQYYQYTHNEFKTIKCNTHIYDVCKSMRYSKSYDVSPWESDRQHTIYLCVSIRKDLTTNHRKSFHRSPERTFCFYNMIPILKFTKQIGRKQLSLKGWLNQS